MKKIILLTGATDGIGLETAKTLVSEGHHVLLHGRNPAKLQEVVKSLGSLSDDANIESYIADLSELADVEAMAKSVAEKHSKLDVIINNAGIFHTPETITKDGFDIRIVVNTLAPYLLTQRLLPLMDESGRVVNLSSAAQSPVNPEVLKGKAGVADDFSAYAQSKLAITMWSCHMAQQLKDTGPIVVSVNPGSLLATKMVKEGFGVEGNDIRIGADILIRAALSDEFATASGKYFDNDSHQFGAPHADALDASKNAEIVRLIEEVLAGLG